MLALAWFLSSLMMHGHIECTLSNAAPLVLSLQPPNSSAGNNPRPGNDFAAVLHAVSSLILFVQFVFQHSQGLLRFCLLAKGDAL